MIDESNKGKLNFISLNYIASVLNYGGRVSDDKDEILIKTMSSNFFNIDITNHEIE